MDAIAFERMLIDFKKKYYTIFATTIGDELFIWRLLTRAEYNIINKSAAGDKMLKEEMVCQIAVLHPQVNFTMYKAGVPTALAPQIVEESGFGNIEKTHGYLHTTRMGILENFTAQAEIVVASAFPQYTFEQMKDWNLEQLLDMVARAEWKLNVLDGKDFAFQADIPEGEEVEMPPKTLEELQAEEKERTRAMEKQIIENGGDPILALGGYYQAKVKKDYVEFPFIMGYNWDREDVLNAIRKQQQSISNE